MFGKTNVRLGLLLRICKQVLLSFVSLSTVAGKIKLFLIKFVAVKERVTT